MFGNALAQTFKMKDQTVESKWQSRCADKFKFTF